ncbi:MAG: 23S rRNA-/tRNA-specific pseudouridylate synthase [Lentimonas sp.]|jgi:23S rRNA-/tRNA-specific pseudouridylate synthase
MSQARKQNSIGFPPGMLGDAPLRMPVIGEAEGWIAVEKPTGVGVREYPWDAGVPDMDAALNKQLQAEKPELVKRGATLFGSAYYLDPAISGVALFAKNRESLNDLRNRVGSAELRYRFFFVTKARGAGGASEVVADAPLLPHNTKPKMIPSTAKGKKARTEFRMLSESKTGWALWEATASFLRPQQIRAHAAVHELSILGDVLYEGPEAPLLSELLPNKRTSGIRFPVFSDLALHLREVILPAACGESSAAVSLRAELPRHFRVMLQRMQLTNPDDELPEA